MTVTGNGVDLVILVPFAPGMSAAGYTSLRYKWHLCPETIVRVHVCIMWYQVSAISADQGERIVAKYVLLPVLWDISILYGGGVCG